MHPNDATAHHWFANDALASLGQSERAVAEMKRALALDPLSLMINANLGFAYIRAGQLDEAIAQLRKTVEMDGSFYFGRAVLGVALELKGQIPEAMAEYEKAIALSDDPLPQAVLGHLYGTIGRRAEATKILAQLKEARQHALHRCLLPRDRISRLGGSRPGAELAGARLSGALQLAHVHPRKSIPEAAAR